ncbi:catechol O-methyltransferase 2 [Penicillium malachiteum]|uniref:catechol O-methyltransferase n=1 Tax=Penicillium malachiteum TaxID=1324776 RepID=A0AAD6MTL9_9EURO|nr:catechol O-methyltransferase 2 [Penicillium malachiteum]KAJ5716424.1 catechol O-methyltransferase 2 [Penicillium malachiteum]
MSARDVSPPAHARPGQRSDEDDRTRRLLRWVFARKDLDEVRGNPDKVLALIDEFSETERMMTVGQAKGKYVLDLINEVKPGTMIELGCFVGYSAILFGDACRRNGGQRYLSLELNPEWAAVANMLVELAGLRSFVTILVGRSDVTLDKLYRTGDVKKIELLFIDHYKPAYLTDLRLLEHHGLIQPGSVLAADNVLHPGNPPYLEYVRSTVEEKREAAKKGPSKGYNVEGMRDRAVNSFMPEGDVPFLETVGNPNLVYQSELRQPEGHRDAIEVTRCVGVQEA